jgi:small conductance mechanosensitive channel
VLLQATPPTTEPAEVVIVDPEAQTCDGGGGFICDQVLEWTDSETAADWAAFLLDKPFRILMIVLVAAILNRIARRIIGRLARQVGTVAGAENRATGMLMSSTANERARQRADTLSTVLRGVATAIIWTIASFLILEELGINLAPLIAGAGIAGVALGFGAQSVVKDVLSGFFMLVEDQFGVGDNIALDGISGTVERVTLRITTLRDINGTLWHVPNGEILRVGNQSQLWSRAVVDTDVAPDADIEHAAQIIKTAADELWQDEEFDAGFTEEPELLGVERSSPEGVTIRLVVKTRPASQYRSQRELRRRIRIALTEAGVPLPQAPWIRPRGEPPVL